MGKATILSNLGNGLYEVRQDIGTTEANASIASLQTSIAELDAQIITATTERNNIAGDLSAAQSVYDAAVTAYAAAVATDPKASTKAWETANVELVRQQQLLFNANAALTSLQTNRAQLARDLNALQDASFERNLQAWCVDYTDDATGEVATIEIPGESKYTLIAPGARAHTAADGRTLARQVMTGPQAYFNAAILPGWQKFKPTYRRGTITALDGDVATVALADDRSSAQNLAINQASTLSGVPIVYQDCNGDVFEVGDDCVIEFQGQNWSNPKVIGFQSNPKECGINFTIYYTKRNTSIGISPGNTVLNVDKKYNQTKGTFTSYNNIDTTRTSITTLQWNEFRTYGSNGDIYFILSTYLPNILESGIAYIPNDGTFRWRRAIIGGPSGSTQFQFLGWIAGLALKKVDADWYVFAVERFGVGSPNFPGYNAQRMLRSKLYTDGNIVGWQIVHEFLFTELSVLGESLPNAGNVPFPVNFNSNCTEAVSLLTNSDNTGIIYSINGINVSAVKTQLAPLTKIGGSVSGEYVLAADYDNSNNLKLLKLSINSTYTDMSPSFGNRIQTYSIGAATLYTGWSSISFPLRSWFRADILNEPSVMSVSNPTVLFFHFWDPKSQNIIYSDLNFNGGSAATTVVSSGAYYVNSSKTYNYPIVSLGQNYLNYDHQILLGIRKATNPNLSDNFARALNKYHLMSRPLYKYNPSTISIVNLLSSTLYFDDNSAYVAINNDGLSMSTIRSAFGGSMVTSPAGNFNQNHSIRVRFW